MGPRGAHCCEGKMDMEADTLRVLSHEPQPWELEKSEEGTLAQWPSFSSLTQNCQTQSSLEEKSLPPILWVSGKAHPRRFSSCGLVPLVSSEKELENHLETSALWGKESFA